MQPLGSEILSPQDISRPVLSTNGLSLIFDPKTSPRRGEGAGCDSLRGGAQHGRAPTRHDSGWTGGACAVFAVPAASLLSQLSRLSRPGKETELGVPIGRLDHGVKLNTGAFLSAR